MELGAAVDLIGEALADVQVIYVFGSVAMGTEHAGSDVDLAVLVPRKLESEARWRLQERLAALLHRSVDLVDLRSASTVMRVEVLRTGRILSEADPGARAQFEMVALSAYADLNESRAAILADIKERGSVHG